jgi:hypothetical protein
MTTTTTIAALPTRMAIRMRALACQLHVVNGLTVRCRVLYDVVNSSVPRREPLNIIIYAMHKSDAHAKLELALCHDDGRPEASHGEIASVSTEHAARLRNIATNAGHLITDYTFRGCPQWRHAAELFMDIVRARGLSCKWAGIRGDGVERISHLFDKTSYYVRDHSHGAPLYILGNTLLPELSMWYRFSTSMWPEER